MEMYEFQLEQKDKYVHIITLLKERIEKMPNDTKARRLLELSLSENKRKLDDVEHYLANHKRGG